MKKALFLSVSFIFLLFQTFAQSAYFTSDSPRCASDTMHFTPGPPGGSILMEIWDFGDGAINTYLPPAAFPIFETHLYTNPGTYNVTRTVKFSAGTFSFSIVVQVLVPPVANFTSTEACLGNPTQFTDMSVAGSGIIISYNWNFGDGGTSSLQSPEHIYAAYGIYNATLTVVDNNGCTHSVTKQVMIKPKPIAEFSFSTTNCIGSPVIFTDLSYIPAGYSGYISLWLWDFGDGTSLSIYFPNNPSVSHTFGGTATTHVVRLTVTTSSGCSAYIEKIVTSVPAPIANFYAPGPACELQPVQFTDISQTSGGGPIVAFNWNFGDPLSGVNNTSLQQNPVHIFSAAATFMVTLVVVNSNGCRDTISKAVPVNPHPYANFTADTVFLGTPTTFTDLSMSFYGSIVSWLWEFGDGQMSSANNPSHFYGNPGTYMARLTVTTINGCSKDTIKPVIVLVPVINPPATQTITDVIVGSGQTKCYNATQVITVAGNGTLFFVLPGGNATFISGQKISFLSGTTVQSGGYMQGYIAPAGPYCVNPSMPATVATGEAISGSLEQSFFKIYPNPSTGNFHLDLYGEVPPGTITVDVYDIWGKKVFTGISNGEHQHEFSLSDRPVGVYFIRVITGNTSETARIIKQ